MDNIKFSYIDGIKTGDAEYIYCFYWQDGKRKFIKERNPYYFFYATPDCKRIDECEYEEGYQTIFGKDVIKVTPKVNPLTGTVHLNTDQFRTLRGQFTGNTSSTFESDVPWITRFLWEKKPEFDDNPRIAYLDIEVLPPEPDVFPLPEEARGKVVLITFKDSFTSKYHLYFLDEESKEYTKEKDNKILHVFNNEEKLLMTFATELSTNFTPDYIAGWNIKGFDMIYLYKRMVKLDINPSCLSQLYDSYIRAGEKSKEVIVKGTGMIDLMEVAKRMWLGEEGIGYSLHEICSYHIKRGKTDLGDSIENTYYHNKKKFIEYNINDIDLMVELDEKMEMIKGLKNIQLIVRQPLEQQIVSSKVLYTYIKQNTPYILGNASPHETDQNLLGGFVYSEEAGIWDNVYKFDFSSYYPSVMLAFNVFPDAILDHHQTDAIKMYPLVEDESMNFYFDKNKIAALFTVLEDLYRKRLEYKRLGKKELSIVYKTLINSLYGVLGYMYSRIYCPVLVNATTFACRNILKYIKRELEKEGIRIIYSDTDSLAIYSPIPIEELTAKINKYTKEAVAMYNGKEDYIKIELEHTLKRFITIGIKKKYVQLDEKGHVTVKGIESVRSDTPQVTKDYINETIKYLLETPDPKLTGLNKITDKYLAIVKSKKSHEFNQICIKTKIRKSEYKVNNELTKAVHNGGLKLFENKVLMILFSRTGPVGFYSEDALKKYPESKVDFEKHCDRLIRMKRKLFDPIFVKNMKLSDFMT